VETAEGRIGYGPVTPLDVPALFEAGWLKGGAHALRLGRLEEHAYLKKQVRFTFSRVGVIDPLSLSDYRALGGYRGLEKALRMGGEQVVEAVARSGLRGRGGAAFPTGIKWRTVRAQSAAQKYIACNADEGDSGTFSDRMLMEGDPFALIEGMTIAGMAVGATQGYIYLRSEYPHAERVLEQAIGIAEQDGLLGDNVMQSGQAFRLELRVGAGSYICGEETAMLESLEGRRGEVRAKPPLPAIEGLFGQPTVVNNVITLATVPAILDRGAEAHAELGIERSRGTLALQLAGNVRRPGLVEVPFGITLRELVEGFGGGTASGRPIKAVQVGGPLGAYVQPAEFDLPLDYEAFAAKGLMVGHGGVVVFDDTVSMASMARYAMEFCAIESCGKCTPCRIGSTRGVEVIDRLVAADGAPRKQAQQVLLRELCDTMQHGSLCALGGLTPFPVISALDKFPRDFGL
jgi:formate dehydrogenase iron-sulfur subunit